MRNVKMLRTEANFVSIPVEQAIYCENCNTVSNSTRRRCGVCGSEAIFSLTTLIDPPLRVASFRSYIRSLSKQHDAEGSKGRSG